MHHLVSSETPTLAYKDYAKGPENQGDELKEANNPSNPQKKMSFRTVSRSTIGGALLPVSLVKRFEEYLEAGSSGLFTSFWDVFLNKCYWSVL